MLHFNFCFTRLLLFSSLISLLIDELAAFNHFYLKTKSHSHFKLYNSNDNNEVNVPKNERRLSWPLNSLNVPDYLDGNFIFCMLPFDIDINFLVIREFSW